MRVHVQFNISRKAPIAFFVRQVCVLNIELLPGNLLLSIT